MSNDVVIRSTIGQISDFLESVVWQDMQSELHAWIEGVRDNLESLETDEKDMYRNQGRADACRHFLSLPQVIKDTLEEIAKSKTREE